MTFFNIATRPRLGTREKGLFALWLLPKLKNYFSFYYIKKHIKYINYFLHHIYENLENNL